MFLKIDENVTLGTNQFGTNRHVNKHNTELQRTDPGTKDKGKFSSRSRIFPDNKQN